MLLRRLRLGKLSSQEDSEIFHRGNVCSVADRCVGGQIVAVVDINLKVNFIIICFHTGCSGVHRELFRTIFVSRDDTHTHVTVKHVS